MARRVVLVFTALVGIGVLSLVLHERTTGETSGEPATVASLAPIATATGAYRGVTVDRLRAVARGHFEISIEALTPDLQIADVSFSLAAAPNGERTWHYMDGCGATMFETRELNSRVHVICQIEIPLVESRSGTYFPFDSRLLILSPVVCVNPDLAEPCAAASSNARITSIAVELDDPDFVVSPPEIAGLTLSWSLRRRPFLRVATVLLGLAALVYFILLLERPGAGGIQDLFAKSFGFLGVLWGLRGVLVPSSIKIFPTLVDIGALGTFLAVFVLILWRYTAPPNNVGDTWAD